MRIILGVFASLFCLAFQVQAIEMQAKGPAAQKGVCGGFVGAECSTDEWCDFPDTAACGVADQQGQCKKRPEICIKIYRPVCGCDDKTYGNDCVAAANGVDVAYVGRCRGDARS